MQSFQVLMSHWYRQRSAGLPRWLPPSPNCVSAVNLPRLVNQIESALAAKLPALRHLVSNVQRLCRFYKNTSSLPSLPEG
jgi:hypothetical protein